MIQSHAEQNAEHYKYLRTDPFYREQFMQDVMYEELMMQMPVYPQEISQEPKIIQVMPAKAIRHRLEVLIMDLQNRLNKHIDAAKRKAKPPEF